jgi:hypothetical protein
MQARLLVTGCVALHRQVNIKQGDIKKAHPSFKNAPGVFVTAFK